MDEQRSATVIVARTAKDGAGSKPKQWLLEIVNLASTSPGFVRSDVQPPGPQHPNEWVVVYEFEDRPTLDAWLSSPRRIGMVENEPELFVGRPREQVLATQKLDESVTAVAAFRLRSIDPDSPIGLLDAKSTEEAFALEYEHLSEAVARSAGFLRCDLFPAVTGVQDETIIVFSFQNRKFLDAWLESDERQEALDRIRPLLEQERTLNVVGGFAGWFGDPDALPVKTWKSAALILSALYPTALAVGFVRDLVLPDLSGPLATLIGNAGGVVILSWGLMPVLTARFAGWLRT